MGSGTPASRKPRRRRRQLSQCPRRTQLEALLHDLGLAEVDQRGVEGQLRLGPGAQVRGLLEALQKGFAAVGVAAAVLFHEAHEDGAGPQHLGPAHAGGQKVGIAEGHVAHGHARALGIAFGQRDGRIREGRSADGLQGVEADDEAPRGRHAVEVGDVPVGLLFARLGALAVVRVKQRELMAPGLGDGRGDAAVHAAGEGDDREFSHGSSLRPRFPTHPSPPAAGHPRRCHPPSAPAGTGCRT